MARNSGGCSIRSGIVQQSIGRAACRKRSKSRPPSTVILFFPDSVSISEKFSERQLAQGRSLLREIRGFLFAKSSKTVHSRERFSRNERVLFGILLAVYWP